MKKIAMLTIMLLISSYAFGRSDWGDKLMQFNKTANEHKTAWFNLKKEYHTKMMDLLTKIHTEWTTFRNDMIQNVKNAKDCSETSKDKLFEDEYTKAIKLHKSHCEAWKNLHEEHNKKVDELAKEQSDDMQNMDVIKMAPTYIR